MWRTNAAFAGSNEEEEIETLEEFLFKFGKEMLKKNVTKSQVKLNEWNFTEVDFSVLSQREFLEYDFNGSSFFGCKFPAEISIKQINDHWKCNVYENNLSLPFKVFRSFLYKQDELQAVDESIYAWYLKDGYKQRSLLAATTHDFCIQDALFDYLEGKSVVAIMGGHGLRRKSQDYKAVAALAYHLTKKGLLVVTGGGPGAMEAANFGAYMSYRSLEELMDGLEILSSDPKNDEVQPEYTYTDCAKRVIQKYGSTDNKPSLGVPTWKYGHEPSNVFASFHAKLFSNAVREDGIISIANCGVIYTPGSAGTRQEIFQDACRNHYSLPGKGCPMVFYGTDFWKECGIWDVLQKTSEGLAYHQLLLISDNIDEIAEHFHKFRISQNLPEVNLELLEKQYWMD